jgi:PhzF family phenazine biosynthesis protein
MAKVQIYRYDAFTKEIDKGNPAGIIFDADQYSTNQMQEIAKAVGYNECCFICKSEKADLRLRYFTPGHEATLCGHATVAGITAYMERDKKKGSYNLLIETLSGLLNVSYDSEKEEVIMEQGNAEFLDFKGDKKTLLAAIGLNEEDMDDSYPIVYGSTGSWTLILPIKRLESFYKMIPFNDKFPSILKEKDHASIHPITSECVNKEASLHGRHFSSCYSGTIEDSVTGTASGVMGAYYIKYMKEMESIDLIIEQGNEIGKQGIVHVWAKKDKKDIRVSIAGQAVKAKIFEIEIE